MLEIVEIIEALNSYTGFIGGAEPGSRILCPAHTEDNPSFVVYDNDEGPYYKCFAGCEFTEIKRAVLEAVRESHPDASYTDVGLGFKGSYSGSIGRSQRSKVEKPTGFEFEKWKPKSVLDVSLPPAPIEGDPAKRYRFLHTHGATIVHERYEALGHSKNMPWVSYDARGECYGSTKKVDSIYAPSVFNQCYGVHHLDPDDFKGCLLVICEGEKDADTVSQVFKGVYGVQPVSFSTTSSKGTDDLLHPLLKVVGGVVCFLDADKGGMSRGVVLQDSWERFESFYKPPMAFHTFSNNILDKNGYDATDAVNDGVNLVEVLGSHISNWERDSNV